MSAWPANNPSGFGSHWLARSQIEDRGDVVTFYSYKGGTGRSMALINCAGLIAHQLPTEAKPLLLIDFDLEAPGLHRYLTPFLDAVEIASPRAGTLELFEAVANAIDKKLGQSRSDDSVQPDRLDDEATAKIIDDFDFSPYIVDTTLTGLRLIMAGRFDDDYGKHLARFNWEALFNKAPALFRSLADRFSREYSFTFIDSRTGLSDTSGICTMLLPDVLVLVFTPNNQSLTGIEHLVRKAVDYRANASDSRPLRVYPLPSRVDNQVEHFRQVWRMGQPQHPLFGRVMGYEPMFRDVFQSILGMETPDATVQLAAYFDVVQVPHSADYSYGERLCFNSNSPSDSLSIRGSYEQFLPWLTTGALPWQRPAESLLNQEATLWLRAAGVDNTLDNMDGWSSWFEHLSQVLDNPQHPVILQHTLLAPELRFDTSVVLTLAYAYRREFRSAIEYLQRAMSSYNEEVSSSVPTTAPSQLCALWSKELAPKELNEPDGKNWIEQMDRLMQLWQPLRNQRQIWLSSFGEIARKAAWYDLTRAACEEQVTLNRDALGDEHPSTLTSMNNLATTLWNQGDHSGARALEEKVLEVSRRTLGDEHPDTLNSMNNLATTLKSQGDHSGARALEEKVLEVRRRVLGDEHPDTLNSMNNLATTLWNQGDHSGARALEEKVLEVRRRVLGDEHPDTLNSMNNLATTLWNQGDHSAARTLQEKVLEISRRSLGDEHPDTLNYMNNLATTLRSQGGHSAARALEEKVLEVSRRSLGDEHPNTLNSMNNLASTLWNQGDHNAARALEERALEIRRRVFGDEHPDTLTSMNNLATTLWNQGDHNAARALQEKVLEVSRRVLGDEHPNTLTSMNNLATTLWNQNDYSAARALQEKVLEVSRRVLGDEHPDTLNSINNLASTLWKQRDHSAARALQEKVLEVSRRVLGDEHPNTLTSMNNLATTLRDQGDHGASRALQEKVLEVRRRILGDEHPNTLTSMNNLAGTLWNQGELSRAYELFGKAWGGLRRGLGNEHPSTWTVAMSLCAIAIEIGKLSQAAEVLDTFKSPQLTTDNTQWLGQRIELAEKLGVKDDVVRYQRRLLDLLKKSQTAPR